MREVVSIALVGAGGYGNNYVSALLDAPNQQDFRIQAAIDPHAELCRRLPELKQRGVPVYKSLDEFHNSKHRASLTVICSPLQLHASQTIAALERGSHVLCEKPLCVTPQQVCDMKAARDAAGKIVAIGYQWSFTSAIQDFKADILSGKLGAPKRMRTLVLWPRDEVYYGRNRWAGAKQDEDGNLVLDSPVNNACAHYLHNAFYVLGSTVDRSAWPARLTAELYRANPIENYDTAALRCFTTDGVEILFLVSHATHGRCGPIISYEFENATVDFVDKPGSELIAHFRDGTTKSYGSPNDERFRKLWDTIDDIREHRPTICGVEASAAHTQATWCAQQSMPDIVSFPKSILRYGEEDGARRTWVEDLADVLAQCYEQWAMPSDLPIPWAHNGKEISVNACEAASAST